MIDIEDFSIEISFFPQDFLHPCELMSMVVGKQVQNWEEFKLVGLLFETSFLELHIL